MMCSCPKCDSNIDIDLARISEAGQYTACPVCRSKFWAQRESFINRAFKKEGQIYCVNCDAELGLSHNCPQCSTLMPDYCLVQKTKPPRRKVEGSSFSLDFSLTSGGGRSSSQSSSTSGPVNKSVLIKAVIALVIVAVAVAASLYIKKSREENSYVTNYVRSLYGITSGVDKNLDVLSKMKNSVGYALNTQDIEAINNAKAEIDNRMSLLQKVPEKYLVQNEQIVALYAVYGKLYTLTLSPSALTSLDKAMVLESDFKKYALSLKSSLTPELASELKKTSVKYKNLGIFIN